MAKKGMSSTGLDGAKDMLKELEVLTGTNSGCAFVADAPRFSSFGSKTAPTHMEVIDYLAKGGRDIRANNDDVRIIGDLIVKNVAKHLKLTGRRRKGKDGTRPPDRTEPEKALRGLAVGLRNGGRTLGERMVDRMESQKTNKGDAAKQVTRRYASRRKKWYGVSEGVVYVASTQLGTALINGKVKVFLNAANADRLLANING